MKKTVLCTAAVLALAAVAYIGGRLGAQQTGTTPAEAEVVEETALVSVVAEFIAVTDEPEDEDYVDPEPDPEPVDHVPAQQRHHDVAEAVHAERSVREF